MKEAYLYHWRADSRLTGLCYSTVKSYLCVVKPDYSLTDIRIHTGHSASYRYICVCILHIKLMRTPAWVAWDRHEAALDVVIRIVMFAVGYS